MIIQRKIGGNSTFVIVAFLIYRGRFLSVRLYRKLLVAVLFSHWAFNVFAATITLSPGDNLQQKLDASADGDMVKLSAGRYVGNFVINHQLTLSGEEGAIIDADGQGNALLLKNSNITIENLVIENWGHNLTDENSGIYSATKAENITIKNNKLTGDGFGIWLHKINHAKVINNTVQGNINIRSADRGNGIQISSIENAHILANETSGVRDGQQQ